jgi:hypothetical protein
VRIGIDFDNTIVCYDRIFHRVAAEQGLIPNDLPSDKASVRDWLRSQGREQTWIEMQGYVYGERMRDCPPFAGVKAFLRHARRREWPTAIISHKTRHPYAGPRYDLHAAARAWLAANGFLDPDDLGLTPGQVVFKLTKTDKLAAIEAMGCSHFIDDLPEFLTHPAFPQGVVRLLFDPHRQHGGRDDGLVRFDGWDAIRAYFDKEREIEK